MCDCGEKIRDEIADIAIALWLVGRIGSCDFLFLASYISAIEDVAELEEILEKTKRFEKGGVGVRHDDGI